MSKISELEKLYQAGSITRREFLGRVAALGATVAVAPTLFNSAAHAAAPKKGGRLRLGLSGGATTNTLDPGTVNDPLLRAINWQIRNNLVEIDLAGNAIPELAESWESTPDAKKWTFQIRKGVEFHNGKTLDADDVIFSINHHRGEGSKSAAYALVTPIQEIGKDGNNNVVITLKEPNADFPFILSDVHLSIIQADTDEFAIGTGGYQLNDFEPGVRTLTKRFPNYWKADRAFFNEVENLTITDVTARTNALLTGQVDVMDRCELKTVNLLEKSPKIQLVRASGRKHYTFPMMTDVAPYDNFDVRMALKCAIDREHMVKTILRGFGTVGNDHPIAPVMRYHASDLPQRIYDPEKAKFHMQKAGLSNHIFKLHVAEAAFPGAVDAGVLYTQHAAKAGITIKVVREPNDGYWKNVWLKKSWVACIWSGRPTEDMMFATTYADDSKWNDTHWHNKRFNQLLRAARGELDDAKRRVMYREMQQIVSDDGGVIVPMFAEFVCAASAGLQFSKISGHYELDGSRCAERWWFA